MWRKYNAVYTWINCLIGTLSACRVLDRVLSWDFYSKEHVTRQLNSADVWGAGFELTGQLMWRVGNFQPAIL